MGTRRPDVPASGPSLRFRALGPLEVRGEGDGPIPLGPPLQRGLLAALLLEAPATVPTVALLERLWGADAPATATKSVQKYVSNLRRLLGPDAIAFDGGGYRLVADPDAIDLRAFEAALRSTSAAGGARARLAAVDDALALWRGEPFADLVDLRFLEPVRRHLEEVRLALLEERLDAQLALGEPDAVIAASEELIASHPFRERVWQARIAALAAADRQADALEAYRALRDSLADELGIDPSPASRELERRILAQEPAAPERSRPVRGNLPGRAARVIGRDEELDRLTEALDRSGLVTLIGPGGVGKTTVALELARRRLDRHRSGAWLIELGPVTDPERVPGRAAEVLGIHEQPDRPVADHVATHLRGEDALLVVDNCEHVIGAAAALIGAIRASAPGVRAIATSREPLGIAGETVVALDPLAVPPTGAPPETFGSYPSYELLAERAAEAGARLDDGDVAEPLAAICRRLDGIPLAIELAAARLRAFRPAELAEQLERRLGLLANVRRDVPSRHRTLEATIDWSLRLLPDDERWLFLRLSVFRGGFDLAAAERVCGGRGIDVASAVAGLVDRSLVTAAGTATGTSRYRILLPIRRRAEDLLGDDAREVRARHAEHFAEVVGPPTPRLAISDPARMVRIGSEYENVRAALAFLLAEGDRRLGLEVALALAPYWGETGALTEGQTWLVRALAANADAPPERRAAASLCLSFLLQPSSSDRSLDAAEDAARLAAEAGDEVLAARAAQALGRLHAVRMEPERAIPLLERAVATLERTGDDLALADCYEALGVASRGATDHGIPHFRRAVELYRRLGAESELSQVLFSMAYRSLLAAGELDAARAALHESLDISLRHGSRHTAAHAAGGLGQLARLRGEREEARRVLRFALGEFDLIGDRRCTGRMLTALGRIASDEGDDEGAWSLLADAISISLRVDVGPSAEVAESVDALVLAAARTGRPEAAARWLGAVEAVRARHGLRRPPPDQEAIDDARAAVAAELGAPRAAELLRDGAGTPFERVAAEARSLARDRTTA